MLTTYPHPCLRRVEWVSDLVLSLRGGVARWVITPGEIALLDDIGLRWFVSRGHWPAKFGEPASLWLADAGCELVTSDDGVHWRKLWLPPDAFDPTAVEETGAVVTLRRRPAVHIGRCRRVVARPDRAGRIADRGRLRHHHPPHGRRPSRPSRLRVGAAGTLSAMAGIVYFAHSYRPEDARIVDYFARLIEAGGLLPSLDPPSDRVNTAKLERHLLHSDAMVVVLTEREPSVSPHLLYEMSLAIRLDKPLLVFVEDTLSPTVVPPRVLQYRFSRRSFPRSVREHRQALRILREQVGEHPPPSHRAPRGRRGCLVVGRFPPDLLEFLDRERRYEVLAGEKFLVSIAEHPIGHDALAGVGLVVALAGDLTAGEHYLLGLADSSRPTIRLSADAVPLKKAVPAEYLPRPVPAGSDPRDILGVELDIFEEDFLNLEDEAKTQRYVNALVDLGGPSDSGHYGQFTRDRVIEVVHGDRYDVRGMVGALGPQAHAHDIEMVQLWERNRQQLDLARLAEELAGLLPAMRSASTSPQTDQAMVELGQAQQQARAGNGPAVMRHLRAAGRWALETAGSIGASVVETAIKIALGLGP